MDSVSRGFLSRLPPTLLALSLGAAALPAQASPYLPLDDPRLPLFEHLVARGEVRDPSPMVRPFLRREAVRALEEALARGCGEAGSDCPAGPEGGRASLMAGLLDAWRDDTAQSWWAVEARAGAQGYTEARRDPLHPAGPGRVKPYGELGLNAVFGNIVLVSRPAIEPRLTRDPDWPGRRDLQVTGRHLDGYLSAQFRWARIYYGQGDQNWGPVGLPGIGLSDYGYPFTRLGLDVGSGRFTLRAQAATLADATDSTGRTIHRYWFGHRIDLRASDRLQLGLWETMLLAGPERSFDGRYRNPVALLLLANEYGLGDDGNVLLGLDLAWRVSRGTRVSAQLALDDFQYQNRSGPTRVPDRYAFTLQATGALGRQLSWHAAYSQASSLALRAENPWETFEDQGTGIGRAFTDNDQITLSIGIPVRARWLLTPDLTLLRQGEGRLPDPFPQGTERGATPALLIGTVERTWRAGLALAGREGPLGLRGQAGVHQVENAGHQPGRSRTRFAGRIEATVALGGRGRF